MSTLQIGAVIFAALFFDMPGLLLLVVVVVALHVRSRRLQRSLDDIEERMRLLDRAIDQATTEPEEELIRRRILNSWAEE